MGPEKIMRDNMNKLLLASTALVASTTFAMADVSVSGFAEMGIFGGEAPNLGSDGGTSDIDPQFHTDIDVFFDMSGETDSGITFGASVDLNSLNDEDADGNIGAFDASQGGDDTSIFVSGALGTLTMGDTDGAFDFVMTEAIIGGSIQDDNEHAGWSGNSGLDGRYRADAGDEGQIARYDYAFGDFSVALSAEIDDDEDTPLVEIANVDFDLDEITTALGEFGRDVSNDTVLGIGFRYAGEFSGVNFGAGLGYQQAGSFSVTGITVDDQGTADTDDDTITDIEYEDETARVYGGSLDFAMDNGFQGIVNYSEYEDFPGGLDNHFGIAVGYEFDAFLVSLSYGQFEIDDRDDRKGYALVGNYDLGGGAELQGSYAMNELSDGTDFDRWSFGIAMSF